MSSNFSNEDIILALKTCGRGKFRSVYDYPWNNDDWLDAAELFGEAKAEAMREELEKMRVAFFSIPHCPKNKSVVQETEEVVDVFESRFPNAPKELVDRFASVFLLNNR